MVTEPDRRRRLVPMRPRRTDESHRASTPLELLFDLSFVVAVSQAARELNGSVAAGDFRSGITGYLMVFFAIWWAWVNFTWFASAYDVDDTAYRLLTFVQIVGVLILAAGIPTAFEHGDFSVMTVGYVVMRIALVTQWLRAASGDPDRRSVALRYASGISVLQAGWVIRLFVPHALGIVAFYVLAGGEMLVPAWAERGEHGTPWHAGHISERYGLFTLIVLGEGIAAATLAIGAARSDDVRLDPLLGVAVGAVILVCSVWWWYFEHPAEDGLRLSRHMAFLWGYGHFFVFASVAALGAGLEVAAEVTHRGSTVPAERAGLTIAIAVGTYLVVTGVLQSRLDPECVVPPRYVVAAAALILVVGGLAGILTIGVAVLLIGLLVAGLVAVDQVLTRAPADGAGVEPAPPA
jgi:low temperature requirement protein LtrA